MTWTQADIESLERATLDAVAPPHVEDFPGWLLSMDNSTIGRAISAVPLRHTDLRGDDISAIEARYVSRNHCARFRVADTPSLQSLHNAMRAKGYVATQATLVQTAPLSALAQCVAPYLGLNLQVSDTPTSGWGKVYTSEGFDPVDGANRVRALSRSSCVTYAWISDSEGPVAAGTASMGHGWLGIHGMRTAPAARGRGYAKQLIAALAAAGLKNQFSRAYLQVEEGNVPAVSLYARLGFLTGWRYHYWIKE